MAQRSILPVRTDHHSKPQVRFEDLAGGTYTGEYSAYCRPTSDFCGQLKWAWGPEIVQAGTLQCLPAGEPGHCNAQCRQLQSDICEGESLGSVCFNTDRRSLIKPAPWRRWSNARLVQSLPIELRELYNPTQTAPKPSNPKPTTSSILTTVYGASVLVSRIICGSVMIYVLEVLGTTIGQQHVYRSHQLRDHDLMLTGDGWTRPGRAPRP